jgi:LemA protein
MPAVVSLVVVGLLIAAGVYAVVLFNQLIGQRNRLREAWSGIDVQLKRRHDLVPNLVTCVQGYRDHEKSVLENLTQARVRAQSAAGIPNASAAENELTRNLRSIFVLAEAYPQLKADQNFRQLSTSLVEIEDNLQYARRFYNGTVRDYNNLVQTFPGLLLAQLFRFAPAEFFEIETATERNAPEVKL